MSAETIMTAKLPPTRRRLRNFLFLDLSTCTRCRGTDRSLGDAMTAVAGVLRAAGTDVEVNKVHVATEEQAHAWRLVASPTIRVDGADVALELRESSCGSEACTDGCGDHIACRTWVYRGRQYTEPPASMVIEAILRHVYGVPGDPAAESAPEAYELPESLRRFFAGKGEPASTDPTGPTRTEWLTTERPDTNPAAAACCPVSEQHICCDAAAKPACCGDPATPSCGCR